MAVRTATSVAGTTAPIYQPRNATGTTYCRFTVALVATDTDNANDEVRVFLFPENAWLTDLSVDLTDIDGGTTLVWDMAADDGTTKDVLISGSTVGQAAGSDELDNYAIDFLTDVGGKWLVFDTTTAGTGVAGTLTVKLGYTTQITEFAGT